MAVFAPKMYQYYRRTLGVLREKYPWLRFKFERSIFPGISFNFGPQVVTATHRDNANLADGWCWILAGGRYNPTAGGHLILWELGLIIEFPPGASILIPSAIISHGNVPVGSDESRFSMTQYAAGGLFRWVEYGFRSEKTMRVEDPKLSFLVDQEKANRWKVAIERYSNFADLARDREMIFRETTN